ncbi:MAG TPA: NAD-dependent epimerase/dehydratase family protein [Longimicrobiales bacterium]|nr:NAD-dependent epimerase/dehydratase family protein [Longimicrobiales bacterium]
MTGRKVLVTGGAGFIGSHVVDAFLERGDRVWIVDDLSSGRPVNVPASATFVHMDIRDADLADVFRDAGGFDVISHHAAQIDVRKSVTDPRTDASINVDGFLNVAELARAHGTGRLIFVSSGGVVYGEPVTIPTPESAPKLPGSPYGVTKLVAEHYMYYYARVWGMEYVALRYANVYGPRQDPHGEAGVVAIFCNRLLDGTSLTIFGDGEQTRDYVFVGDVVRANLLAADVDTGARPSGLDERAYNVGTGKETSVNELARTLMTATGREAPVEYAAARPGELQRSCLDTAALRARGWKPMTTLEQGLEVTFRHIEKNR